MKILITGGAGYLSQEIIPLLQNHDVYAPDKEVLDITDMLSIKTLLNKFSPEIIIHTAAATDVDKCEVEPYQTYLVNSYGTENIVRSIRNQRLFFLSTDYVFNGKINRSYSEFDPPDPLSIYGNSKLYAERIIENNLSNYIIIRTSWMINGKNDFITKIINTFKSNGFLKVIDDQRGSPTMTWDISQAIVKLIDTDYSGILNISNSRDATWFEIACFVFQLKKWDMSLISKTTKKEYNLIAERPDYSVLSGTLFKHIMKYSLPDWKISLKKHKELSID